MESHSSIDFHDLSNMDIAKSRDIPQQIPREISPQNPQVINDFPITCPSPHPRDFESQIKEIDMALKKFDSHDFSTPNMIAGISIFAASNGDNSGVIMNRVESGEHQNLAHVGSQLLPSISDTIELRKWKKLARNIPKTDSDTQSPVVVKQGRKGGDEIQLEYLAKNIRFQEWTNRTFQWRRLLNSPAKHHEYHCMELSWAWEPTDSEGA